MDQSLDLILRARRNKETYHQLSKGISSKTNEVMIIDRFKVAFDSSEKIVTITRASDDVPFACKIGGCRMPYELLQRMIDDDLDEDNPLEGFEWL
ncbi:MAG: hypothetical protein IJH64_12395 [Oscillospiraceae bacterium]|nr:hypothetical protein [Oscillospiraceae bacterium]